MHTRVLIHDSNTHPHPTNTNNLFVYVLNQLRKLRRNVSGASFPMFVLKQAVKKSTNLIINDCAFSLSHPPFIPVFPPSSANSKYLSGGLPGVYAVLDVSNPGVFLQGVYGFQDVLSPVFHLLRQPNTITHWALFKGPHQGTDPMLTQPGYGVTLFPTTCLVSYSGRCTGFAVLP